MVGLYLCFFPLQELSLQGVTAGEEQLGLAAGLLPRLRVVELTR
jgi:hypothetical protein